MEEYMNYIGGKWTKSSSGDTFESLNPATSKPLGKFQQSNVHDTKHAIEAAEKGLEIWRNVPAPKRGEILLNIAQLLKKDKQRLGKLVTKEMGKVLPEGLGDVQEAIDVFDYMAGEGRRLFGRTTPSELKSKFCATVRIPAGVVGLITPWNFPIAIPSWKLSAALICGNGIVIKPSSDTPLCATELVKIIEKAGVPGSVVNMVTGPGSIVGAEIVKNKKVRALSFTGHRDTGSGILQQAGIKKVSLEMGSKNGIIIMEDADLHLAAEGVIWGAFGTTGQRCTAASRVIVHKNIKNKFEKMLVAKAKKLRLGNGLSGADVGPLVNKKAVEKTDSYVKLGKKEGAKLLCGGSVSKRDGFFYEPTVFTNTKKNMKIAQEEIFGPVLAIISVKDINEAIDVINSVDYGLSSSIYTNNIIYSMKAIERIETGMTYVNSSTIGAEVHLPFGGIKGTGNGAREAGWRGIEEFSEEKTIYIDYSGKLQKAQIDD
jgi:alpha-ketoglutaric semialdehyde dehydrogenase